MSPTSPYIRHPEVRDSTPFNLNLKSLHWDSFSQRQVVQENKHFTSIGTPNKTLTQFTFLYEFYGRVSVSEFQASTNLVWSYSHT